YRTIGPQRKTGRVLVLLRRINDEGDRARARDQRVQGVANSFQSNDRIAREIKAVPNASEGAIASGRGEDVLMVRSQRKQILIVENSPQEANLLVQALNNDEYETQLVSRGKDAVELLRHTPFDILITDLQLPDMEGNELIQEALARYSEIVPIAVATTENVGTVVEAVRNGASDCILFPLESDQLYRIVRKAVGRRNRHNQNRVPERAAQDQPVIGNIIGESKAMQDIFELVQSISKSNTSVLITGETGT